MDIDKFSDLCGMVYAEYEGKHWYLVYSKTMFLDDDILGEIIGKGESQYEAMANAISRLTDQMAKCQDFLNKVSDKMEKAQEMFGKCVGNGLSTFNAEPVVPISSHYGNVLVGSIAEDMGKIIIGDMP